MRKGCANTGIDKTSPYASKIKIENSYHHAQRVQDEAVPKEQLEESDKGGQ
jgi:hypothetical protein